MIQMKQQCEKCKAAISNEGEAYICSYECTYCPVCALSLLHACSKCGGELVPRPRRTSSVELPENGQTIAALGIRSGLVWTVSFGIWTFISLAATASIYEMYRLMNNAADLRTIAGPQFSTILTYAPICPFVFAFALRYPIRRQNWARRSLLYLGAIVLFSLAHVALKAATPYGYWDSQSRAWSWGIWNSQLHAFRNLWRVFSSMFVGDVLNDICDAFLPTILIAHVVSYYHKLQERERRATQLEAQLTKARLQTLKSQLQPHFLFNTLHSISALMLTDITAADRMMISLSDLLRLSLENDGTQITTLSREIEFLDVYLDIEKTRFEDRLHVLFDIDPECLDAQVPHLLLQPLVENAVRHGVSKRSSRGEISVIAKREGRDLRICVRDNGPGFPEPFDENFHKGLGLKITRERLLALYGGGQSCEARNLPEGGAEVCLRMPFSATSQPDKDEALALGVLSR
jgi:two-component system, LytTR family, sensor kinase